MAEHYYSQNPEAKHQPIDFTFTLRGHTFHFQTDQGVFSKKEVDFGSRVLLDLVTMPETEGPVLDMGCGYGPIGLALATSFPGRHVHMVDINTRAVELAEKNAARNHISNVSIYESNLFEKVKSGPFALIATNPPIRAGKQIVHRIFEESYQYLAKTGNFGGHPEKAGRPFCQEKLESIFDEVDCVGKEKGYFVFKAKKI